MKHRTFAACSFAVLAAASIAGWAQAQTAPAAAPAAQTGGVEANFKPGFDDMMTMVVQPRHIKLYYAGQAKNWPLAQFQLNELRHSYDRIANALPKYRTFSLKQTLSSMSSVPINSLNQAIAAKDSARFLSAYNQLTESCNACHEALGHPQIVMKTPTSNPYTDQDFSVRAP
jgi:hypothetical protein